MKRSEFSHARELSGVLNDAHVNDGAFVGISDAALIVRALRWYGYFGRAKLGAAALALAAPVLAVALWPLADLDRDGRLSANDAAVALHGVAMRMEADGARTRFVSADDGLDGVASLAAAQAALRSTCRLTPLVEAASAITTQ